MSAGLNMIQAVRIGRSQEQGNVMSKSQIMGNSQGGVAIVLAMGVVALATMAATAIMITQSTWARQGELTAAHVQAQTLIQAGVDWARAVLSDDRRLSNVDHPGEPWALRLPPIA